MKDLEFVQRGGRGSVFTLWKDSFPQLLSSRWAVRIMPCSRYMEAIWRFKSKRLALEFMKNPKGVDWESLKRPMSAEKLSAINRT